MQLKKRHNYEQVLSARDRDARLVATLPAKLHLNPALSARAATGSQRDALVEVSQPLWLLRLCCYRNRLSCMSDFTPTERTKVKRKPDRGSIDRELIYSILDQAFDCTVGFIVDGLPYVVPTNYVRVGDKLFLHGSTASRLMRTLSSGAPFCLSVTLLDGIVFSPTATGHSVNYRSVVVMGKAEVIESPEAKLAAMRDFVDYVLRGRWATA